MIKVSVMPTFYSRLRSRGWNPEPRRMSERRQLSNEIKVLTRGEHSVIVVQKISVDPQVAITPQIDGFFQDVIKRFMSGKVQPKNIFLPGGGTIPVPKFFQDFCKEAGIQINLVTSENFDEMTNDKYYDN